MRRRRLLCYKSCLQFALKFYKNSSLLAKLFLCCILYSVQLHKCISLSLFFCTWVSQSQNSSSDSCKFITDKGPVIGTRKGNWRTHYHIKLLKELIDIEDNLLHSIEHTIPLSGTHFLVCLPRPTNMLAYYYCASSPINCRPIEPIPAVGQWNCCDYD